MTPATFRDNRRDPLVCAFVECRSEIDVAMSLYRFIEKVVGFSVERLSRDRLLVQLEPWALSLS
jgi:hypothetical protein